MIPGLSFHHHGLAVRDDRGALSFVTSLGYVAGNVVHDPLQGVKLRLCTHDTLPTIEIVMPGETDGPLGSVLARGDGQLYHTCYEVVDRAAMLDQIEQNGSRIFEVAAPKPAILFDNRLASFHMVAGFGLIELLDKF